MDHSRMPSVLIGAFASLLAANTSLSQNILPSATFTAIPLPAGLNANVAQGISADGTTVVGWAALEPTGREHAFSWVIGQPAVIIGPTGSPYTYTEATVASSNGSIVAVETSGNAFRWSASGGVQEIPVPSGGDRTRTAPGMSANGNVVAGYFETASHEPRAYVWTAAGGTQALPLPDPQPASNEQYAKGVSADGTRVVGWSRSASGYHGFLWSNSSGYLATSLGLSGGSASYALAISGDGSTVLGRTDSPGPSNAAWLWSASSGYTTIPLLSGITTIGPTAISGNGTTVVGAAFPTEFADPILWTAQTGTLRIADILTASGVDLTGWTLGTAYGVSFDGTRIVGVGEFGGERRGWLVTVPSPGAASILVAGAACFGLRRRR